MRSVLPQHRNRRHAVWGVILMAFGVVLLLEQLEVVRIRFDYPWWPAIPMLIGLVRLLTPETPRQFAEGLTWVLIGLWLFACEERWYGLTYWKGWPLLLVIWGFEMVFGAVLERLARPREEQRHVP
jgi:hypothetical protein